MTDLLTPDTVWEAFARELPAHPADAAQLQAEADAWLGAEPITVTAKPAGRFPGEPRDYVSQAPYWWPDPQKPDSLPYIRRDGEVNPEMWQSDRARITALGEAVTCLTLQVRATGDARYAEKAGAMLRTWFLDETTGMRPHLRYAQFIPGICEGRCIGLIDTAYLCFLLDVVGHLPESASWTPADRKQLRAWFSTYLDWLLESESGREEARQHNNHGSWYDAQVICFAAFCGREDIARRTIEASAVSRLGTQIEADGRQPHELSRTLSQSYCTFNLTAYACIARIAEGLGLDLWSREHPYGARLLATVEWMAPYYRGARPWEAEQIEPFIPESAAFALGLVTRGCGKPEIAELAKAVSPHPWCRISTWKNSARSKDWPAGQSGPVAA